MPFRTACIYDIPTMNTEKRAQLGTRILTMRKWPRGASWHSIDLWIPALGPSVGLLDALHKKDITFQTFATLYKAEIRNADPGELVLHYRSPGSEKTTQEPRPEVRPLDYLLERARATPNEVITLLCWEKDGEPCHRTHLLEVLKAEQAYDEEQRHPAELRVGDVVPADFTKLRGQSSQMAYDEGVTLIYRRHIWYVTIRAEGGMDIVHTVARTYTEGKQAYSARVEERIAASE